MAALELLLLGSFRARLGSGDPLPPLGRKATLLLACLAIRAGEVCTREKLIGLLWSDRADAQARASLRQELTVLRRVVGQVPAALAIDGERLSIDPAAVAVDVQAFEALARSDAVADLERAASLYRGPLLDGLAVRDEAAEQWLAGERERLRDLFLAVLDRLLAGHLREGALQRATEVAQTILAQDPLREPTHRMLMALHAVQGQHSLALRQYQVCRDVLDRELGIAPEPATEELHRALRERRRPPAELLRDLAATSARAGAPPAAAPAERPAIAVLPFVNMSGDPEQDYFADGLTDDIITDLSRVSALSVVARHKVFALKGKAVAAQQAARDLGAGYVLEGSVRKAEARVRITVQLIDGASGAHLWANRFDRELSDIFALQDEISQSIVEALKVRLLPEELASITNRPTSSAEAYQYYLMGRSFFLRSFWGRRALVVARQMFAKAIEVDPGYARAHAGVANCDSYLMTMGDPDASFEAILASSARALALEPQLAEAHAARGLVLFTAGRNDEANAALKQAVALGPALFEPLFFCARNYRAQGRYEEAAALFERAADLQPSDFRALGLAVSAYRALGRREALQSAARRCLERVEAELALHPDIGAALAFGAMMLAELGDPARAVDMAARCAALASNDSITNYNLACALVALGQPEAALERLRGVFAATPAWQRSHVAWMRHDSAIDPLRDHPGFKALVAELERANGAAAAPVDGRPAIAVLPFATLSGNGDQVTLADGIVDEITAALSRVRSFVVIARSSTLGYRDRVIEPALVGRELGVRYLLQGTVRASGERVRIAVQLVEAATGACIWADRYEGRREDVFDLEDRITERVVGAIEPTIRSAEIERARRKRPDSLAAYDYVMRALPQMWALTPEASEEALRLALEAVRLDPGYARAHALASWCHVWQIGNGWAASPAQARAEALRLARTALRLDADDPNVLTLVGAAEMMLTGDLDAAAVHVDKALALDPNAAWTWIRSGYLQVYRGDPDTALAHFERAARLSPFDPLTFNRYIGIAMAHFAAGRNETAVEWAEKARVERPGLPWAYRVLVVARTELGQHDAARAVAQAMLAQHPNATVQQIMATTPFRPGAARDRYATALRLAGIPEDGPPEAPPREARAPARPADRGLPVAVLPFDNLSGDRTQEYFSDGLSEDLITALTHWRSFPVIARNSTFAYKGRALGAMEVARELGAGYVVEGSVRREGERLRVAAQLIDADGGHHLWAARYDRALGDVFALQDELSLRIAAIIAPEVERAGFRRSSAKRTGDVDAWDCYLRGNAQLHAFTREGNAEARRQFERAVALDPHYSDALAGLASGHLRDLLLECASDREAALRHGMAAAQRAVAADPASSAAHAALATAHLWRNEHDAALVEARLAVELNPYDAMVRHALGNKLDLAGDPDGIEHMVRAQQLNPRDPDHHSHLCFLARAYVNARRYEDAVACAQAALRRHADYPNAYFILAIALGHLGRGAEGRAALEACEAAHLGFVAGRSDWRPYVQEQSNAHLREGLRLATGAA